MSYEDSFEREAEDERAYKDFEHCYIYENLKPETIGRWEWDLMFDRVCGREIYSEAASDAVEMARELGTSVVLEQIYEGWWMPRPIDYYEMPNGSYWTTYATKRAYFIRALVREHKYPDIAAIAAAMNHPARFGISRHSRDELKIHQRLLQELGDS